MQEVPFTATSYQEFLKQRKLMGTRCVTDGQLFLPPRALCPDHFSGAMEWVRLSGRGRLAAFSIIYIGTDGMIEAGYHRKNPYCAAIIALEEGPQISAQLLDVDPHHPETIRIGMPVQADYIERENSEGAQTFLAFRPAG